MKSEKWNEGGFLYKHTLKKARIKKLDEHAKKYLDGGELENGPFIHPRWRPDFRFMSGFEMLSAKGGGVGGWVGQDLSGQITLKNMKIDCRSPLA